jgi:hypothetical protein
MDILLFKSILSTIVILLVFIALFIIAGLIPYLNHRSKLIQLSPVI